MKLQCRDAVHPDAMFESDIIAGNELFAPAIAFWLSQPSEQIRQRQQQARFSSSVCPDDKIKVRIEWPEFSPLETAEVFESEVLYEEAVGGHVGRPLSTAIARDFAAELPRPAAAAIAPASTASFVQCHDVDGRDKPWGTSPAMTNLASDVVRPLS
jgi:hypothetical protein